MTKGKSKDYETVVVEVSVYTPTDKHHIYNNISAEDYLEREMSRLEQDGIFIDRFLSGENMRIDEDEEEK